MSERDHRVELIEDGGINPEARGMDTENPSDKLPAAKIEDVFRNIEAGLVEIRNAILNGNRMRAKVQLAGIKTLLGIGLSAATSSGNTDLKLKLEGYKSFLDQLEEGLITGILPTLPKELVPSTPPSAVPDSSTFLLPLFCAQCGTNLRPTAKYCDQCGMPTEAQVVGYDNQTEF